MNIIFLFWRYCFLLYNSQNSFCLRPNEVKVCICADRIVLLTFDGKWSTIIAWARLGWAEKTGQKTSVLSFSPSSPSLCMFRSPPPPPSLSLSLSLFLSFPISFTFSLSRSLQSLWHTHIHTHSHTRSFRLLLRLSLNFPPICLFCLISRV